MTKIIISNTALIERVLGLGSFMYLFLHLQTNYLRILKFYHIQQILSSLGPIAKTKFVGTALIVLNPTEAKTAGVDVSYLALDKKKSYWKPFGLE